MIARSALHLMTERKRMLFLAKIGPPDARGCMEWTGARVRGRYGKFGVGSETDRSVATAVAHRVAYELAFGAIPDGLHVCHKCDNPPCCNPAHLFLGTNMENRRDMTAKGRHLAGYLSPKHSKGEQVNTAKLTPKQVAGIRANVAESGPSLAARLGVTASTIHKVRRRQTWKHL